MMKKMRFPLMILFTGVLFFTGAFVVTADQAQATDQCCVAYTGDYHELLGWWNGSRCVCIPPLPPETTECVLWCPNIL